MSFLVRQLRMRAVTAEGAFGSDLSFTAGLNVVRAENSRGKSTAVRALVYALGLELMITTRPAQTLTAAMRDRLIYDPATSKAETAVTSSWVEVELEFADGAPITVRRAVTGTEMQPRLVRVWQGPCLTSGVYPHDHTDYFVGRDNTTSARGFQPYLAERLGWSLPTVDLGDGPMRLYLEQVFPLLLVEQLRGWGGIQQQTPTWGPDARRRAREYMLGLNVGEREAQRARLNAEMRGLEERWRVAVAGFKNDLQREGLVLQNVPMEPADVWPPTPVPVILKPVDDGWQKLDAALVTMRQELAGLLVPVPAAQLSGADALSRLSGELDQTTLRASALRERIVGYRRELGFLGQRKEVLAVDRREHADIVRLRDLGSDAIGQLHDDCPTCHRPLGEVSLAPGAVDVVMSPEDTLAYLGQQLELVEAMIVDGSRTLSALQERLAAEDRTADRLRRQVRALRRDLAGSDGDASAARVERRVGLDEDIRRLTGHLERYASLDERLQELAAEAQNVRSKLKDLPRGRALSDIDTARLADLQRVFLEQLRAYEFSSMSEGQLSISDLDYLPKREAFDLQADISASDTIRVIWAYLIALMEISQTHHLVHPQWLLFDEPRQQSAKDVSFQALLQQAARVATAGGGQIIFVTSEEEGRLRSMLKGVNATFTPIDGYLLKRVEG